MGNLKVYFAFYFTYFGFGFKVSRHGIREESAKCTGQPVSSNGLQYPPWMLKPKEIKGSDINSTETELFYKLYI